MIDLYLRGLYNVIGSFGREIFLDGGTSGHHSPWLALVLVLSSGGGCLFAATPPIPKYLPGAPEFNQLADHFLLKTEAGLDLLVTTHRIRRPNPGDWRWRGEPSAFGLWKVLTSRFVFIRRLDASKKVSAQWAKPFKFQGITYIRFSSVGGHGITSDEIFRVQADGSLTPIELDENSLKLHMRKSLRDDESLGYLYFSFADDHLGVRAIACPSAEGCSLSDQFGDFDVVRGQLTIIGERIGLVGVVRLTATEAAQTR